MQDIVAISVALFLTGLLAATLCYSLDKIERQLKRLNEILEKDKAK